MGWIRSTIYQATAAAYETCGSSAERQATKERYSVTFYLLAAAQCLQLADGDPLVRSAYDPKPPITPSVICHSESAKRTDELLALRIRDVGLPLDGKSLNTIQGLDLADHHA